MKNMFIVRFLYGLLLKFMTLQKPVLFPVSDFTPEAFSQLPVK